jgi:hypothetical protein
MKSHVWVVYSRSQPENEGERLARDETFPICHRGEGIVAEGTFPSGTATYQGHQSNVPNDKAGTGFAVPGVGFLHGRTCVSTANSTLVGGSRHFVRRRPLHLASGAGASAGRDYAQSEVQGSPDVSGAGAPDVDIGCGEGAGGGGAERVSKEHEGRGRTSTAGQRCSRCGEEMAVRCRVGRNDGTGGVQV